MKASIEINGSSETGSLNHLRSAREIGLPTLDPAGATLSLRLPRPSVPTAKSMLSTLTKR